MAIVTWVFPVSAEHPASVIWHNGALAAGRDLTLCCRSTPRAGRQSILAVADKKGLIRLFHWPASTLPGTTPEALMPLGAVRGMCGSVDVIRFSVDATRLYATHGKSVFEWRVHDGVLDKPVEITRGSSPTAEVVAVGPIPPEGVSAAGPKATRWIVTVESLQGKLTAAEHRSVLFLFRALSRPAGLCAMCTFARALNFLRGGSVADEAERARDLGTRNKELQKKLLMAQAATSDLRERELARRGDDEERARLATAPEVESALENRAVRAGSTQDQMRSRPLLHSRLLDDCFSPLAHAQVEVKQLAEIASLKQQLADAQAATSTARAHAKQNLSAVCEASDLRQEVARVEASSAVDARKIVEQRQALEKRRGELEVVTAELAGLHKSAKRMKADRQRILQSELTAQRDLAKMKESVGADLARREYTRGMQAATTEQHAREQAALRKLLSKQKQAMSGLGREKERAATDTRLVLAELGALRGDWDPAALQRLSLERLMSLRETLAGRQGSLESIIEEAEARVHRLVAKAPAALSQQLEALGGTANANLR